MHRSAHGTAQVRRDAVPLLDAVPGQRRAEPPAAVTPPDAPARSWPWRLLPTPTGTPFTFCYLLVLVATSLFAAYADPDTVSAVLRESSTDVAHLAQTPLLVLVASALWIAGGLTSPYALGFALVLTALERRIGGWRTAGVFLLGHVVATLATEIPVGLSVAAGHLPETSLHRLDYGISFGLMASVGALAGLLTPLVRTLVLGGVGVMLAHDLLVFTDPLTGWGHPLALLLGVGCWPPLHRRAGVVGSSRRRPVLCRREILAGRCSVIRAGARRGRRVVFRR